MDDPKIVSQKPYKISLFLLLTFIIGIISCNVNSSEKKLLNYTNIESIELTNGLNKLDNNARILTDNQMKRFVSEWNNSQSKGPCETSSQFTFEIKDSIGNTVKLFSNGSYIIKNQEDWCYKLKDSTYIDYLFKHALPKDSLKRKLFNKLQGQWINEEDSLSILMIGNYKCLFKYVGEKTTSDDIYKLSLPHHIEEFVDTSLIADLMIFSNEKDTFKYEILGVTDSTLSISYYPRMNKSHYIKSKEPFNYDTQ